MTLFLSFFFILSSNVIIFNLPLSQGNSSGYYQSTLSEVLTPIERLTYIIFGTLPSRIYYSYSKRSYVVRGQPGRYKNDLRTKRGKNKDGYVVMPRWQYYLNQLSPDDLIKSGMEYASMAKGLLGLGRGFTDFNNAIGDDDDLENSDNDENDTKSDADNSAKDNKKDSPGMFSSLPSIPTDLLSSFTNGDSNNENKDDKADGSTDYTTMAKEALQSDTAKDLVKTGISLFVPGGPAIVAAMEAGSKLSGVTNKFNKVPKFK